MQFNVIYLRCNRKEGDKNESRNDRKRTRKKKKIHGKNAKSI